MGPWTRIAWVTFRVVRWALWGVTAAYYLHFFMYRENHLNAFGHLLTTTELWMFGLPLASVFAGFLELMMRNRGGFPRPALGRNWTG